MSEKPIELTTGAVSRLPRFSVIWLHGLGADGSDFVPIVPELGLPKSPAGRFIFPHAPYLSVTCNGGYSMPHTVCMDEVGDLGRWLGDRLRQIPGLL